MKNNLLKHSQAGQDVFALEVVKKNKTYIEIGANHFKHSNNTYPLEVSNNWLGFSLELSQKKFRQVWEEQTERTNKIYWENAITFDYANAVRENKMPTRIGYLSCDIEPAANTFAALKKVIEDGISFDCITFEHDNYKSDTDYDSIAREYLKSKGYKVAVENVYAMNKPHRLFETWFVNNDIGYKKMSYEQWKILEY
jgi:hypothetical protein